MEKPRGIRNNNPLNIRRGSLWVGLRPVQTDDAFCQFTCMEMGFRAAFRIFRTYYVNHGLRTLYAVINRWAPFSENNTHSYVELVTSLINSYSGKVINPYIELASPMRDKETWSLIVRAMMCVECGKKWADLPTVPQEIGKGWLLAFDTQQT